jgi:hypothetical protein
LARWALVGGLTELRDLDKEREEYWNRMDENAKAMAKNWREMWEDINQIWQLIKGELMDPKTSPFPKLMEVAKDATDLFWNTMFDKRKVLALGQGGLLLRMIRQPQYLRNGRFSLRTANDCVTRGSQPRTLATCREAVPLGQIRTGTPTSTGVWPGERTNLPVGRPFHELTW